MFLTATKNVKEYFMYYKMVLVARLSCAGVSWSKTVHVPNFVVLYFQTMFEAWHNSALSAGYMQKFLSKMQREMAQLEAQELAPPGWRVIWNRYSG